MNDENNYFYENQIDVIEDNVNVTKTSDIKEFFILITGIIVLICGILFVSDFVMQIFLDKMSYDTQVKIESFLSFDTAAKPQYTKEEQIWLNDLNNIHKKILSNDEELKNLKVLILIYLRTKKLMLLFYRTVKFTLPKAC